LIVTSANAEKSLQPKKLLRLPGYSLTIRQKMRQTRLWTTFWLHLYWQHFRVPGFSPLQDFLEQNQADKTS